MKALFALAFFTAVILLAVPSEVEAQKKTGNRSGVISPPAKCSVVVRNDLLPRRGVVVVGCDSFGIDAAAFNDVQGRPQALPSNGGVIVFDVEMNVVFRWTACTACGGFFSSFAGLRKFRGHNALLVKLVGGPRRDDGKPSLPLVLPLYFNGKEFKLDRYSTNNVVP